MSAANLWLCAGLGAFILASLAVSLWLGRKVPTLADRLALDLAAYRVREIELEALCANARHDLSACREHIKRLDKRLSKTPADKAEAATLHIVGRAAK